MVWVLMILYLTVSVIDCVLAETMNFSAQNVKRGRSGFVLETDRQASIYRAFRVFKFCLMPLLLIYYVAACLKAGRSPSALIMLALAFGFGGDFLLEMGAKWFPVGTLSFLLGHIFYVIAFLIPVRWSAVSPIVWVLLAVYIAYGAFMLTNLFKTPAAYELRHVLIVYLAALVSLSVSALLRSTYVNSKSFVIVYIGSLLFLLSDTILAFSQFQEKSRHGVMITYTAAQFLLIFGLLMA